MAVGNDAGADAGAGENRLDAFSQKWASEVFALIGQCADAEAHSWKHQRMASQRRNRFDQDGPGCEPGRFCARSSG